MAAVSNWTLPNACYEESNYSMDFPCSADPIDVVSLGLGSGGIALLFVLYLYKRVRKTPFDTLWND